jgi:phosphoribosylformylglycinamidine synthase
MVGVIENQDRITTLDFKNEGDAIVLIGKPSNDINSSQYLAKYHKVDLSPCPYFDLDEEFAMQQTIKDLISAKAINSCHDVSEGGIFVSLLESAMTSSKGFEINADNNFRKDAYLFGEAQGRAIVTISQEQLKKVQDLASANGVEVSVLGSVKGSDLVIDGENFGSIDDYRNIYDNAIEKALMN